MTRQQTFSVLIVPLSIRREPNGDTMDWGDSHLNEITGGLIHGKINQRHQDRKEPAHGFCR
jgi:hypothetical protein